MLTYFVVKALLHPHVPFDGGPGPSSEVLTLLALLVQKYKY